MNVHPGIVCSTCKKLQPLSSYYFTRNRYITRCKLCTSEYNRKRHFENPLRYAEVRKKYGDTNRDKNNQRSREFYYSINGRAKTMLKQMERRTKQKGWSPCEIEMDWILERLNKGTCELTGIEFQYRKLPNKVRNPFVASIDRIDSSIGYTLKNCRMIIWQINLMKGELSDIDLFNLCNIVVGAMKK